MSSDEFDFDDDASMASSEDDNEDDDSFFEENDHPNQTTKDAKNKKRSSNKSSSKKSKTTNDSEYDRNNKEPRGKKTVEQTYQKKTQLEHILLRPDTYIGSVEPLTQTMFVLTTHSQGTSTPSPKIQQREITYTPGLYKIFDEILVNAADNKQRDSNMDRMEIVIDHGGMDGGDGVISVLNNGRGIPVVKHKEHDCYVPTLIFGHLLTVRLQLQRVFFLEWVFRCACLVELYWVAGCPCLFVTSLVCWCLAEVSCSIVVEFFLYSLG